MKFLFFCSILLSINFVFSQNMNMAPTNKQAGLMYPEYPAEDQPEPRISNSLILRPFNNEQFEKAQKDNKNIVLVFSKADCPGCRAQIPTLIKVLKEPEFQSIEVFQIDFINQPDLNKKFNVPGWTHLVGFKGNKEVKRAAGAKSPSQIRTFLKYVVL